MLQKTSRNFHSNCQESLWTLTKCHFGLCHTRESEKKKVKIFSSLETLPFFQNFFFQQPLRCYRNDLLTSTVIVRILFGPLWIVTWGLSHSIKREKLGQNLFFTGKVAFFFKKLCFQQPRRCYRNDLVTATVIVKKPCGPL